MLNFYFFCILVYFKKGTVHMCIWMDGRMDGWCDKKICLKWKEMKRNAIYVYFDGSSGSRSHQFYSMLNGSLIDNLIPCSVWSSTRKKGTNAIGMVEKKRKFIIYLCKIQIWLPYLLHLATKERVFFFVWKKKNFRKKGKNCSDFGEYSTFAMRHLISIYLFESDFRATNKIKDNRWAYKRIRMS